VSVDTYKPEVRPRGRDGGREDRQRRSAAYATRSWRAFCALSGAGLVVMHTAARATGNAARSPTLYEDVAAEVLEFLRERIEVALERGMRREQLIVDPGPGLRQDACSDDPFASRRGAAAGARTACV